MASIVIPIKTNNQRLPGKNTMLLCGKPLYQYLFDSVKKCKRVDNIYVDSSDEKILEAAHKNNFKTIKRPSFLNSAETSGNDLINHALKYIDDEIIGQFFVTTPFIKSKTIDKGFEILQNINVDSCFGVYPVYDRFWKDNKPVNHAYDKLVGTQYMSPLYRESGFYLFKKSAFVSNYSRITKNFKTFLVDKNECIDIDTKEDFMFAEFFMKNYGKTL